MVPFGKSGLAQTRFRTYFWHDRWADKPADRWFLCVWSCTRCVAHHFKKPMPPCSEKSLNPLFGLTEPGKWVTCGSNSQSSMSIFHGVSFLFGNDLRVRRDRPTRRNGSLRHSAQQLGDRSIYGKLIRVIGPCKKLSFIEQMWPTQLKLHTLQFVRFWPHTLPLMVQMSR